MTVCPLGARPLLRRGPLPNLRGSPAPQPRLPAQRCHLHLLDTRPLPLPVPNPLPLRGQAERGPARGPRRRLTGCPLPRPQPSALRDTGADKCLKSPSAQPPCRSDNPLQTPNGSSSALPPGPSRGQLWDAPASTQTYLHTLVQISAFGLDCAYRQIGKRPDPMPGYLPNTRAIKGRES